MAHLDVFHNPDTTTASPIPAVRRIASEPNRMAVSSLKMLKRLVLTIGTESDAKGSGKISFESGFPHFQECTMYHI